MLSDLQLGWLTWFVIAIFFFVAFFGESIIRGIRNSKESDEKTKAS